MEFDSVASKTQQNTIIRGSPYWRPYKNGYQHLTFLSPLSTLATSFLTLLLYLAAHSHALEEGSGIQVNKREMGW